MRQACILPAMKTQTNRSAYKGQHRSSTELQNNSHNIEDISDKHTQHSSAAEFELQCRFVQRHVRQGNARASNLH
jgi:hypothetical protein